MNWQTKSHSLWFVAVTVLLFFAGAFLASTARTQKREKAIVEQRENGPDHPDEAARFRRLQLQDEKGKIPIDGLEKARQHVKRMRVAAKADPKQLAGIKPESWEPLGPGNIGGRIRSIVISPINTDRMWVGSVSGGIWRTTDGGDSWFPVNDFMANLAVSTMIIDPTFPGFLYAGTGENNGSQNTQGAGVFKSTDSGITWNQLPSTNPVAPLPAGCNNSPNCPWLYVNRLAISPTDSTILAATWNGIYRSANGSINGGMSWTPTGNGGGSWLDIDFHPTNSARAIAGNSGGAVFSTDGGANWTAATFNPPITGRVELAYAPSSPNIIYASVNNNNGEVYRSTDGNSTDGSMTFTLVNTTNNFFLNSGGNQGEYDNIVWVNPQDPAYVIVGGINLWRSTNSGTNFTQISDTSFAPDLSVHADHHAIVAHPGFNNTTNRKVFFGNDGGLYQADDILLAGVPFPWSGWIQRNNNLGITQFYGAAGNTVNGVIVGGTQDNGTLVYSGSTDWAIGRKGDGGYCAASPDGLFYYGEYVYLQIHRNTGLVGSFLDIYGGIGDAGNAAAANFIAPFILDPNDANRMLAGGVSLWRSTNVRDLFPTWSRIMSPLANNNPISAIVVSPSTSDIICVGYNNGDILYTSNGTATQPSWFKIDAPAPALPDGRMVTRLVIDNTRNPNWIYVTYGGFSDDNVYRTTDNGTTWTDITGGSSSLPNPRGLPAVPVRTLVYHPRFPNFLYVGTEVGIFTSEDAGATWEVPQNGPANVSVDELFWMGGDLIAATHGRGLYRASGGIYVDCNYNDKNGTENGTFDRPFKTISAALSAAPTYRTIWLKPCTYFEPEIDKRVELRSLNGPVTIRKP